MDRFDLQQKVIVVTGAGSGIGRATAIAAAVHGAVVIATDLGDTAEATARTVREAGGSATAQTLDVSDRKAIDALFADVEARHHRLDGLVTSAGVMIDGSVADLTEATLRRGFSINLEGTVWCARAAAAMMTKQRSGSIVTISSTAADIPAANTAVYAMTKAALNQFTRVLAMESAAAGVRVNSVAPGVVRTGITERHYTRPDGSVDEAKREVVFARLAGHAPMKRIGEPEEIADAVLFLLSGTSSFMTGQILRPNGGAAMA